MNETTAIWHQTYSLFGLGIGLSALIAALPIFTLLFLLGVLRKQAWFAGVCGLAAALLLATLGYGMPVKAAISASVYGGAFGLFPICWIIFWAIALFRVTVETGKFEIIRNSIERVTPDPRMQALLVAFCFGAFLEGGAGFGTPVAVAATMLVGMGFPAFSAAAICLLANTAPVAFGAMGIPVITLAGTTGLPLDKLSRAVALLCSPFSLILPVYLLCRCRWLWRDVRNMVSSIDRWIHLCCNPIALVDLDGPSALRNSRCTCISCCIDCGS